MSAQSAGQRTPAEWVTLAISIAIVGSLVAIALIEEANRQDEVATSLAISFDMGATRWDGENYYVPFHVTNGGSQAVASADIWFEIYDGEALVETDEITVAFLPLQGRQEGVYVTARNPATHALRARLESVQFP